MSRRTRSLPAGRRRRGLRARLIRTTAGVTALAMAAAFAVIAFLVVELSANRIDAELGSRIDEATAHLTVANGVPRIAGGQADDVDDGVWLFDDAGRLVSAPPSGPAGTATARSLARVRTEQTSDEGDRRYLARPVRRDGQVVAVVVASASLAPYASVGTVALLGLIVLGVVVTAGTALLTAWTVGRTLRPIHQMTVQAAEWSRHDLEARFSLQDGADEFTELADTLDVLLDRVAAALAEEQRLTGELAHELRTPLTAIRAEAELGRLSDPHEERFGRIMELVDRLSTTINTLLAVARAQGGGLRSCDVYDVVTGLVSARGPSATRVEIGVTAGELRVATSPEILERAIAPVLDNASRHARSVVRIEGTPAGRQVVVTIADDGPGIGDLDAESIFTVGTRASGSGGAGLGLALAQRLTRIAGGSLALTSAGEPTTFEFRFPRL